MWTCPKCSRIFQKKGQAHSCKKVPLESHFEGKEAAKKLYDFLLKKIKTKVGPVKEISLPCCVHLFGKYDFIAILPKKDSLELRFILDKKLKNKRFSNIVPMSGISIKYCLYISSPQEIDQELLDWLKQSYSYKK